MTAFQSRLGKDKWLTPATDIVLEELPDKGIKNVTVACPSFTADCLETLEEIEMRGREDFLKAGGETYSMVPCLNDQDHWVKSFSEHVQDSKKLPWRPLSDRIAQGR